MKEEIVTVKKEERNAMKREETVTKNEGSPRTMRMKDSKPGSGMAIAVTMTTTTTTITTTMTNMKEDSCATEIIATATMRLG